MSDEVRPARPPFGVIAVIVPAALALSQVAYLYILNRTELGLGFPIDDAYIFQRYSMNLAAGHGFSFNPGEISFGCTSVLWPMVMALLAKAFYFLDYVTIAFWVGGNLFALAAFLAGWLVLRATERPSLALLAGLIVAGSPTLCMNAVSGMETPLTLALVLLFAGGAMADKPHPIFAGAMAGLLALARPEGLYFMAGAAVAWVMVRFYKDKDGRVGVLELVKFFIPWAWLAAPAYVVIHGRTGSWLPTTFLGKILSTSPGTLDRTVGERAALAAMTLGDGWMRLAAPLRGMAVVIAVGVLLEVIITLVRVRRGGRSAWTLMGRLTMAGYLLLPMAYGLAFPVGPAFGGYYNRYIAPVLAVAAVLGLIGLHDAAQLGIPPGARKWWRRGLGSLMRLAGVGLLIAYLGWLWGAPDFEKGQARDAEAVFKNEVRLNTGLRMEAAKWLASPANVPKGARVMAGYTGLGVIGMNCGHYVLDIGALINPDIFDYYRPGARTPEEKWEQQVKYMHDRGISYYVTFAIPNSYADKIAEPARTPGFEEVARFGDWHDPPLGPLDQIRIYRISWPRWRAAKFPFNKREEMLPGP